MCCGLKVALETEALRGVLLPSWVNRVDESPLLTATGLFSSLLLLQTTVLSALRCEAPHRRSSCSSLHYYKHFSMTSWIFPFTASVPIFAKISPVHASHHSKTLMCVVCRIQTFQATSSLYLCAYMVVRVYPIQKWKPTSSSFNASLLGAPPALCLVHKPIQLLVHTRLATS